MGERNRPSTRARSGLISSQEMPTIPIRAASHSWRLRNTVVCDRIEHSRALRRTPVNGVRGAGEGGRIVLRGRNECVHFARSHIREG